MKQFADKEQIVIGQADKDGQLGSQVDIQLDSAEVSAIHCLIEKRGSDFYVCDLGSTQGTFKNGTQVIDEKIGPGDEVQVGPFKIVFLLMPQAGVTPAAVAAAVAPSAPTEAPSVKPAAAAAPVAPKVEQPAPAKKPVTPAPVASAAPSKPVIHNTFAAQKTSGKVGTSFKTKKSKYDKTFAPANAYNDLNEFIRTGRGDTVQVIISWKGRVLDTLSLKAVGSYKAGIGEQIQMPPGTLTSSFVLLDCSAGVTVNIPKDAQSEVKRDNSLTGLQDSRYKLGQDEVVYLTFSNGIQLAIRYATGSKQVIMDSPIILSSSELTGILCALIIASLMSLIVSIYTPRDNQQEEEVQRVAQVIFNKPPPALTPPIPPPPVETPVEPKEEVKTPPPPEPKKVVMADQAQVKQNKGDVSKPDAKAQQAQKAGRATEVAPKDPKLKAKMFTSTKQGGAIKTGDTAGANMKSKDPDPTNAGLLAAFGGGGARSKLDKAYSGSGELLGAGSKATGTSGFNENRAGDDLGSKFRDTGAGGKGTATQGIAGVGTQGRGTGMSAFGSGDGLGSKDQVAIQAGGAEEEFVGSIDKEAVRRAVRSARAAYRACYERELKRDTKLEGKVVIAWEIHEKGVARKSRVVKDKTTLGNPSVEDCIRERILAIRFPEPPPGTVAEVVFPFFFSAEK